MARKGVTVWVAVAVGLIMTLATSLAISAAGLRVAALFPGSIGDQSWNSDGFNGLQKIKSELGAEIAFSENVAAADHVDAFRDYARRGFDLIFGHSGRFVTAADRVASGFPKTRFVIIAGTTGNGSNVDSVDIARDQFGYLLGMLGARMSKTDKIGIVAQLEGLHASVRFFGGMRVGAKSVKPQMEVRIVYVASGEDVAAVKEAAFALASGGADVVLGIQNRGHLGLLEAAKEKNFFTNGRAVSHTAIAPSQVLTNIVEDWPSMYVAISKLHQRGELQGTARVFGFHTPETTGASLLYRDGLSYNQVVPKSVVDEIERSKKKLATGELKLTITKEDARTGL